MLSLPPMPTWDEAHPIIVHIPIGLAVFVPVLIVIAIIFPHRRRSWLLAAWAAMGVATIASFVAVLSGEHAGELAPKMASIHEAIEHHEELGELYRTVLAVLTALFVVVVLSAREGRRPEEDHDEEDGESGRKRGRVFWPVLIVFCGAYLWSLVLLANTGHAGGLLVHYYGVHAPMTLDAPDIIIVPGVRGRDYDDDDD